MGTKLNAIISSMVDEQEVMVKDINTGEIYKWEQSTAFICYRA